MARGRIKKETVDAFVAVDRQEYLWDDALPGFGLKATPTGAKSYLVQYRIGGRGAPTRRFTIGSHGPVTPDQARKRAKDILALVQQGTDPQATKTKEKKDSVDLAFDTYAERFLSLYGPKHWAATTQKDNERYLRCYVSPTLGTRALPKIKRADVVPIFDRLAKDRAGKDALARNVYAVTRKLFAWAVERGDIERSPFEGFKGPPPVKSRDRVLTKAELRLAWLAAGELGYPFGPQQRLLMATGQRLREVSNLDWRELNRAAAEWNLPADRAKNDVAHTVPLNSLAIAELDKVAGGEKWPAKGFVLTTNGKTPISGFAKAKARLDATMLEIARKEAKESGADPEQIEIARWRGHDLRRTMATGFQGLGVRFEVTEAVLNHVSGSKSGVAGVYQRHDWKAEKRSALDAWAAQIARILVAANQNNVTPIRRDESRR